MPHGPAHRPQRRQVRPVVLRLARAGPQLTIAQIAAAASCHPSTASKHLRSVPPGRRGLQACPVGGDERRVAAMHPKLSAELAGRLAGSSDPHERKSVARNKRCPPVLARRLAADPDAEVRGCAACQPELRGGPLVRLLGDQSGPVRALAAQACGTTAAARRASTGHDGIDRDVLQRTATGPEAAADLIAHCAAHPNPDLQALAAAHTSCPGWLLDVLATGYASVRVAVAENPTTPPETLAGLADDTHTGVRRAAAGNPNCPPAALALLVDSPDKASAVAARNPSLPVDNITAAGCHRLATVRASAAENPSCPLWLLERLAGDDTLIVRVAVAANPNCPRRLLAHLAGGPPRVQQAVAANPNCGSCTLGWLAKNGHRAHTLAHIAEHPNASVGALRIAAAHGDIWTRRQCAVHPANSSTLRARLAADRSPVVRSGVLTHPACDQRIIARLVDDPDPAVRGAAKAATRRSSVYAMVDTI